MLYKNCLLTINPVIMGRGWLWVMRHPFYLVTLKHFRNWGQGTKYYNRRCFHSLYLSENSKFWGTCELKLRMKTKYVWKIYFGLLNDQMYISHKSQLIQRIYPRNICWVNQHVNSEPRGRLAGQSAVLSLLRRFNWACKGQTQAQNAGPAEAVCYGEERHWIWSLKFWHQFLLLHLLAMRPGK